MSRHPTGKNVPIPPETLQSIIALKQETGALPKLATRAGLLPASLYKIANGGQSQINEHALPRVQAALRGETVPGPAKGKPGKLVRRDKHQPLIVAELLQHANGHPTNGADRQMVKNLLNGLVLGVQITRGAVLEVLGEKV